MLKFLYVVLFGALASGPALAQWAVVNSNGVIETTLEHPLHTRVALLIRETHDKLSPSRKSRVISRMEELEQSFWTPPDHLNGRSLQYRFYSFITDHYASRQSVQTGANISRLRDIEAIIADDGFRIEQIRANPKVFCNSQDNKLIDLGNSGVLLHDFKSADDCERASREIEQGRAFCDYGDNTMWSPLSNLIHDFNSEDDCRLGLSLVGRGLAFCNRDRSSLHSSDGTLLLQLSSRQDCKAARDALNNW